MPGLQPKSVLIHILYLVPDETLNVGIIIIYTGANISPLSSLFSDKERCHFKLLAVWICSRCIYKIFISHLAVITRYKARGWVNNGRGRLIMHKLQVSTLSVTMMVINPA